MHRSPSVVAESRQFSSCITAAVAGRNTRPLSLMKIDHTAAAWVLAGCCGLKRLRRIRQPWKAPQLSQEAVAAVVNVRDTSSHYCS